MSGSPQIDLTKLAFASDRLTIKAIRRFHPRQIDAGASSDITVFTAGETTRDSAGAMLTDLLDCERTLAEAAFSRIVGGPPPEFFGKDELISIGEHLTRLYMHYELASGEHQAEELIRNIERQAEAQGNQFSKGNPQSL